MDGRLPTRARRMSCTDFRGTPRGFCDAFEHSGVERVVRATRRRTRAIRTCRSATSRSSGSPASGSGPSLGSQAPRVSELSSGGASREHALLEPARRNRLPRPQLRAFGSAFETTVTKP